MGGVRPLTPDDHARLAELHLAAFGHFGNTPEEIEQGYLTKIDAVMPDVVADGVASPALGFEHDGEVVGFVLVSSRPVQFRDRRVWLATTSHLAVDPAARSSLAAVHLMRAVVDGPQDLTYVDRSNGASRLTMRAAGFEAMPNYSLRWKRSLRPAVAFSQRVGGRVGRGADLVESIGRRVERLLPGAVKHRMAAELPDRPPAVTTGPLTIDDVVECGSVLMSAYDLHPIFDDRSVVEREWDHLARARPNSVIVQQAFRSRRGDLVGWYFADIANDGYADVFQFVARPEHRHAALIAMLHDLNGHGVVDLSGDAPLDLLFDLEGLGCELTTDLATTSVHSSDPEILDAFRANRVWLSALEGEYLLNPPAAVRQ